MNAFHDYTIKDESDDDQRDAGRYNPAQVIRWGNPRQRMTLSAGSSDHIHVYKHEGALVVLNINYGLGYVGLQVRDKDGGGEEIFLQYDHEIEPILGRNGLDRSNNWIARVLYNHLS